MEKQTDVLLNDAKKFIISNIKHQLESNTSEKTCSIIYISGKPGIGKSELTDQIAVELSASLDVKYMSTMMAEQISGLPAPKDGGYIWTLPEIIDIDSGDKKISILFIDDVHLCNKSIQSYMFQLLTLKSIHKHKLADNVAIVLAGNRNMSHAGSQPILSPVANRIFFLDVICDTNGWIENFAIPNELRQDVISFIALYPELLESEPLESNAFATPRSWTHLSYELTNMENESEKPLTTNEILIIGTGHIGLEYTTKFVEYVELFMKWHPKKYFAGTPLPDIAALNKIECYTLASAVSAELIKDLKLTNWDITSNINDSKINVTSEMFSQLIDTCPEIIPMSLKLFLSAEKISKDESLLYYALTKKNKKLLGAIKQILN